MKTKFLAIALVALAPFAASADDISYNYFDISYQIGGDIDPGFGTIDTDGFALTGSFEFSDSWFAQFDYSSLSTDPDIGDDTGYTLSVGWHNEMFFASIGWQNADIGGVDDSGFNLDGGFRTMVGDGFEFNGHIGYSDLGDVGSGLGYGIGAVYMFGDNMGVSFNYDMASFSDFAAIPGFDVDTTTYGLGFRMTF